MWQITNVETLEVVAQSPLFSALPLLTHFPSTGFPDSVEDDKTFGFLLNSRKVEWVADAPEVALPETAEQARARIKWVTQEYLNQTAKTSAGDFDDIKSATLRAALPLSDWHTLGLALGHWGEQCWAFLRDQEPVIAAEFAAGTRTAWPTNEEVLAALPPCPV